MKMGEAENWLRKQLQQQYFEIQRWVSANAGVIMPMFRSTISAYRDTVKGYRDRCEELTGVSLWECPVCRHGRMIQVEVLEPGAPRPPIRDTS